MDLLIEQLLRRILLVLTGLDLLLELVLLDQLDFIDELLQVVADLAGLARVLVRQIVVLPLHAKPLQVRLLCLASFELSSGGRAHLADLIQDVFLPLLVLLLSLLFLLADQFDLAQSVWARAH